MVRDYMSYSDVVVINSTVFNVQNSAKIVHISMTYVVQDCAT